MNACPFCEMTPDRITAEDGPCIAVLDRYPVSRGHHLIVTRRHVASFRELTDEEWLAIHRLARILVLRMQSDDPAIQGFNLGINDGPAAGQTIAHVHVHLIPRRTGDVRRPRGGIRGVIPGKQDYPGGEDKPQHP
ncbi:MAG: HIT domain-containing protein [Verrucomicrobia bacterium]|nr:HIT domain-containing protein [Verrucomicrobiota bacterium]MBU1909429.1 HIT domain-containing protein [Verrucomicrobiota bacterium]